MGIRISCRGCQRPFRVADACGGKKLLCHCGGTIPVPLSKDEETVDESWGRPAYGPDWRSEKKKAESEGEAEEEFNTESFLKKTIGGGLLLGFVLLVGGLIWSAMSPQTKEPTNNQTSTTPQRPGAATPSFPSNNFPHVDPRWNNQGFAGQQPGGGTPQTQPGNPGTGFGAVDTRQNGVASFPQPGPRPAPAPTGPTVNNPPKTRSDGFPAASPATEDSDDDAFGSDPAPRSKSRQPAPTNSVLGTPPVPTVVVTSLKEVRRGMKVWRRDLDWQQVTVAGRSGDSLLIMEKAPRIDWRIAPLSLRFARFEESELDRDDLGDVPTLDEEPDLPLKEFERRIAELKPAPPTKSKSRKTTGK